MNNSYVRVDWFMTPQKEAKMSKEKSPLQKRIEDWKEKGGALPPAKERAKLKKAYVQAHQAREEAKEEAKRLVIETEAALTKAASDCIDAFGPTPLDINGEIFDPMCRGDLVFYRRRRLQKQETPI